MLFEEVLTPSYLGPVCKVCWVTPPPSLSTDQQISGKVRVGNQHSEQGIARFWSPISCLSQSRSHFPAAAEEEEHCHSGQGALPGR